MAAETQPAFPGTLIEQFSAHPVLVDIGASGAPPRIWDAIAPFSTYVGFDPDSRELHDESGGRFRRSVIVNKAVTAGDEPEVVFHLTSSPYCSSVLAPDTETISQYLFADLFRVVETKKVPAVNFNAVLTQLGLERIDWLKLDSQGTDLRLFRALSDDTRAGILAVDLEPGVNPGYRGEDVFASVHTAMTSEGFWLSSLPVLGTVRMKRASMERLRQAAPDLDDADYLEGIRISPFWCEPRYFRSLEWMEKRNGAPRDYILLWIFAMLDQQWGFALDLSLAFRDRFGEQAPAAALQQEPLERIRKAASDRKRASQGGLHLLKKLTPRPVKAWIRKILTPGSV